MSESYDFKILGVVNGKAVVSVEEVEHVVSSIINQHESIATQMTADIQELEKQLEETRQKLTGSFKHESKQQKEIEELRHTRFKRFNNEECWIYQLEEDNFVYSLVCPVVISADDIREIENQVKELQHYKDRAFRDHNAETNIGG